MEIQISNKNEFKFVPDIGNNRKNPENQQFKVFYKRLSNRLHSGKWTSFDENGQFIYSLAKKAYEHIVRFENAPILNFGNEKRELKPKDFIHEKVIDGTWHELNFLIESIVNEIEEKEKEQANNKKK